MRTASFALVVGLVASLLTACSLLPCVERRDESGLLLVCDEDVAGMPEALRDTAASGITLAMAHPEAFGYPWADPSTGELEVRIAAPAAEVFIADWRAGRAMQGTGEKTLAIPRPTVAIRRVRPARSVAELVRIQNAVTPPAGMPDADLVYMAGPDPRHNATLIAIDHASEALLRALADRYGTEAIVIRIASRGRAVPL